MGIQDVLYLEANTGSKMMYVVYPQFDLGWMFMSGGLAYLGEACGLANLSEV